MVGGIEAVPLEEELAAASAAQQSAIFVLESAQLEVAKVGKNYELLNCDDHANFLRRHNKDPALYRPDICHQVGGKRALQ
jgi:rRNA small subunit pseudouridine methyltransferase Nep1